MTCWIIALVGLNIYNNILLVFIMIVCGCIIGFISLFVEHKEKNKPITPEELNKLKCFGREEEGHYSDRWAYSIIRTHKDRDDKWSFYFFNEVDGKLTYVKTVSTMKELKELYKMLEGEELT